MKYLFVTILLFSLSGYSQDEFFSSEMLQNDILTQVESPVVFDWRKSEYEIDFGYDYIDEQTNFNTDGWHLGVMVPSPSGWHFQLGLRRIIVYPTKSSNDLGRTPYKQRSSRTRYQVFTGVAYSLLEGLSITRLSPMNPDIETVLLGTVAFLYNYPNQGLIPGKGGKPEPDSGMEPYGTDYGFEVGLKWQIYTQSGYGIMMGWSRQMYLLSKKGLDANLLFIGFLWSQSSDQE